MTEAPTSTRSERTKARPSRRRLIVFIAALCVVLVAAGLVLWLVVFKGDDNSKKATDAINAGLGLQARGDLAGAYAKYSEAAKLDPHNKFALYDLAVVDNLQSNPGLAEQHYRQALVIDPRYEPAIYNLAIVEQALGKQRFALSLYQQAVQINPGDANAHFNLALMLRVMGYRKIGDAQMRIARKLNPQLVDPISPAPPSSGNGSSPPSGAPSS